MKKYLIALPFLFCAAIAFAQEIQCPPGVYYPAAFNPVPTLEGDNLGPNSPPPTVPPPPIEGLRGIYWVHGLGGNPGSMANISTATDHGTANFPARKTVGFPMSYIQTGLETAGNTLIQNMLDKDNALINLGVTDFSQNFIIGHSQGGMASRMADMLLDGAPPTARRHYGIVTIGSPHLGARIVNSRNDGLVKEMAADACDAILQAKFAIILEEFAFLNLFVTISNQQQGIADLCDNSADLILPFALGSLFSGASNDYAVGAPVLGELQGHNNSETHKTSFYGVEYARPQDDPTDNGFLSRQLIWRMLGTLPDDVSNSPAFGANADQHLVDKANGNMAKYQAKYELYKNRVEYLESWGLPCDWWEFHIPMPYCAWDIEYHRDKDVRDAYYRAWRWSQGVDSQWKIIIGAKETVVSGTLCECIDLVNGGSITIPGINSKVDCTQYGMSHPDEVKSCKWYLEYETLIKESDGVVNAESQRGFPGAAGKYRMNFANHFQERNSEPTRLALMLLYDFGAGDDWFATKVK